MSKKTILAVALATAISATAVQAQAPAGNGHSANAHYRPRVDLLVNNLNQISGAIAAARKNRTISPAEAQGLNGEVHSTRQAISQHSKGGFTQPEFQELAQRVNAVRAKLRMERVDFDQTPA